MVPPEELIAWLFGLVPWLRTSLDIAPRRGTIVLPVEDDFPVDTSLEGLALAEDFLSFVVEHAGMSDRRFSVRFQEERGAAAALKGMTHAMTPGITGGTAMPVARGKPLPIPVLAQTIRDTPRLIALLGRGVAHYRAQEARAAAPGPDTMREAVVDVVGVFLGFGVFLANACHDARAYESGGMKGFAVQRLGQLGPIEMSYALALRAHLVGAEPKEIRPHLRENARACFDAALRDLSKRSLDEIGALGEMPYRS